MGQKDRRSVGLRRSLPAPVDEPPEDPGEDAMDETLADSFPASDPPSWSTMRAGEPRHGPNAAPKAKGARSTLRASARVRSAKGSP